MTLNIVQCKHCSISGRQLCNRFVQSDAIHNRHRVGIFGTFYYLDWRFAVLGRGLHTHATLAEVHKNLIDRKPVKPRSKSRFTPKTADFSKELYENFLSEVFSLRHTPSHPQAQGVHATIVALIKILESNHVSVGCFLRQLIVCRLRCLGLGCRHVVYLLGQAERNLTTSVRLFGTPITLPQCQGSALSLKMPAWVAVGGASALNGAVMRCSERVVALPDPKKCGKAPAESTLARKFSSKPEAASLISCDQTTLITAYLQNRADT